MTDITLDNLNVLENKIFELGNKFALLLSRIQDYLNGNVTHSVSEREFEVLLDEIMSTLFVIKEEMHKSVDDIFKENRFSHLTKLQNDALEQLNALVELKKNIKLLNIN